MATRIKLSGSTEHMIILPIDLEDGGPIIEATMPLLNWFPRQYMREMDEWVEHVQKLGEAYAQWEKDGSKGKPPCDKAELPDAPHKYQVRVLKPYLSDADYQRVWDNVTPGYMQEIFKALSGDGEVDLGESEASADS